MAEQQMRNRSDRVRVKPLQFSVAIPVLKHETAAEECLGCLARRRTDEEAMVAAGSN